VTALARVHALPQPFCGRYDVFDVIRSYQTVLAAARLPLPPVFAELAGPIVTIEQALSAGAVPLVPCHNDPCPGNIIDTGSGICLIDWEYAGMGDPMGDLADLSVEARYASHDDKLMLKTYYGGRVPRAAKSRLAVYKVMSDCASSWSTPNPASTTVSTAYAGSPALGAGSRRRSSPGTSTPSPALPRTRRDGLLRA